MLSETCQSAFCTRRGRHAGADTQPRALDSRLTASFPYDGAQTQRAASSNGATLMPKFDLGVSNNQDGTFTPFMLSTLAALPASRLGARLDTSHCDAAWNTRPCAHHRHELGQREDLFTYRTRQRELYEAGANERLAVLCQRLLSRHLRGSDLCAKPIQGKRAASRRSACRNA